MEAATQADERDQQQAAAREAFDRERQAAGREAVRSLAANADRAGIEGALRAAGARHLDPRFVRGGADRLLYRRLSRVSHGEAYRLVGHLGRTMLAQARQVADDAELSGPVLTAALPALLERWSIGAVRLQLAWLTAATDQALASTAHRLLDEDARLAVPLDADELVRSPGAGSPGAGSPSAGDGPAATGTGSTTDRPSVDASEAGAATHEQDDEDDEDTAPGEDDATLFTTLDHVLIKQAVASYAGIVGALEVDDVHRLADELVRLNTDRHASFFHLGFLDGLDDTRTPELPAEVMNAQRRQWYAFGQLSGLVRRERHTELLELARAKPTEVEQVVRHPRQGHGLTAPLVTALLDDEPTHAARLLHLRLLTRAPFADLPSLLLDAHQRARALLLDQQPDAAEALWVAIAAAPPELLSQLGLAPRRRLISCARARNDFALALERVEALAPETDDPHERAVLETERGLIAAEVSHLQVISLGRTDQHRSNLAARLERGRHRFEEALRTDPAEWRATLCLGVLRALDDTPESAAPLLERARSALLSDPLAASTRLGSEIQFLAALQRLRSLEEGTDGRAFKDVSDALREDGWTPPVRDLLEALDLLTLHGSRHAVQLLELVTEHAPASELVPFAVQLLDNGEHAAAPAAARIARSSKVKAADRVRLLTLAVDATFHQPGQDLDPLVDQLDDLLREVSDDHADRTLQVWLNDSLTPTELYGPLGVDQLRVQLHERLGEFEPARQLLERLIRRTLAAPAWDRPYDLDELLDHHRRRDPDAERSTALAALVRSDRQTAEEPAGPLADQRDVRLLFVGGDERQERITASIEDRVHEVVPGTVHVTWIHPGWSARWREHAERAESEYERSDALVLMPLVRTNLGRRLRRTSGESGLHWVACTGHGVDSITRAIAQAAQVVRASAS